MAAAAAAAEEEEEEEEEEEDAAAAAAAAAVAAAASGAAGLDASVLMPASLLVCACWCVRDGGCVSRSCALCLTRVL